MYKFIVYVLIYIACVSTKSRIGLGKMPQDPVLPPLPQRLTRSVSHDPSASRQLFAADAPTGQLLSGCPPPARRRGGGGN